MFPQSSDSPFHPAQQRRAHLALATVNGMRVDHADPPPDVIDDWFETTTTVDAPDVSTIIDTRSFVARIVSRAISVARTAAIVWRMARTMNVAELRAALDAA